MGLFVNTRTVAFLCCNNIVGSSVGMAVASSVTMAVLMKEKQTENVGQETTTSNNEDELGVGDCLRLENSLYRL